MFILKIGPFRNSKFKILETYEEKGIRGIGMFCACSGVPLVAAYTYILEENPDNKEVKDKMKSIIDFYGYDKIEE